MTSTSPLSRRIADPEVQLLAAIAGTLEADYLNLDSTWAGSPFAWIKTRPSRQVGKIGEQLVAGWCAAKGLGVMPTGDSDADRVINGRRTEIKFSTLWTPRPGTTAGANYVFQQIRDQRYDQLVLLGLSPFGASCWVLPKSVTQTTPHPVGLTPQHGGAAGRDTLWLRFPAAMPPVWLEQYGGTLAAAYQLLAT